MSKRPGKRETLARWLHATGLHSLLSHLPQKDSLLVLNYHRLGDAGAATYDSQVFTATPQDFQSQMEFLARHLHPVTLSETLSWADGSRPSQPSQCRVLITFDDGYVDNFEFALPILRRVGMQGVFFLPTSFIGTRLIPWWDSIAFMLRHARTTRFHLDYPCAIDVDIESSGLEAATFRLTSAYKQPEMTDPERFMAQVARGSGCQQPEASQERCFMDWDEARIMVRDGMALGAHTHTHRLLGSLSEDEQIEELSVSRAILAEKTGTEPETLAYPVGMRTSFSTRTMLLASQVGYRGAFSYYGGVNLRGQVNPFDIQRVSPEYGVSMERFQSQTTIAGAAGRFWP